MANTDCFNGLTFTFNNASSDLYGLYMGWRSASEEWSTGLDREIVKAEMNMVRHIPNQYGVKYQDVLSLEFDIFHQDGSAFTQQESRSINNWLMHDTYKRFKVHDNNTDNVYYKVICTSIQDITLGTFRGKHIVMETDAPFGYSNDVRRIVDATESGDISFSLNNTSDDGVYYPYLTVVCDENYEDVIELINLTDDKTMLLEITNVPIVDGKKVVNIDTQKFMLTDGNNNLLPLYKIGWQINSDSDKAIQSSELYWFRLLKGRNDLEIKGNGKVIFTMSFPRKAGQLGEE